MSARPGRMDKGPSGGTHILPGANLKAHLSTSQTIPPGWRPLSLDINSAGEPVPYNKRQAKLWMLVLASRKIPCQQEEVAGGFQLFVPASFLDAAREQIVLYQQENRNWPPPLPQVEPLYENQLATLFVFILLCGFANITELEAALRGWSTIDWYALGSARAGLIASGEWWRTATALTLHSGGLHLAGNVVFGILFVGRLARDLGSGLAWSLVLAAGMGGNLVNALLQSPQHNAVGASTAVFGAVGLLAGLNLIRYRKPLWRRWALPLAGGFGLLAMLGASGERTDVGAHLFGMLVGVMIGAGCAFWLLRHGRPGKGLNLLLGLLPMLVMVTAWLVALKRG